MNLDPQTQTHKIIKAHQTTTHDHRRSTLIGEAQREKREGEVREEKER